MSDNFQQSQDLPLFTDPYTGYISLWCHFDGADGSTTFVDESPYNLPMLGLQECRISTERYMLTSSVYFKNTDGKHSRIITGFARHLRLLGDFTWEMGIRAEQFDKAGGNEFLVMYNKNFEEVLKMEIGAIGSAKLKVTMYNEAREAYTVSSEIDILNDCWYYLVLVMKDGQLHLYLDDIFQNLVEVFGNRDKLPVMLSIGAGVNPIGFEGYIEELRITNGVARAIPTNLFFVPEVPPLIAESVTQYPMSSTGAVTVQIQQVNLTVANSLQLNSSTTGDVTTNPAEIYDFIFMDYEGFATTETPPSGVVLTNQYLASKNVTYSGGGNVFYVDGAQTNWPYSSNLDVPQNGSGLGALTNYSEDAIYITVDPTKNWKLLQLEFDSALRGSYSMTVTVVYKNGYTPWTGYILASPTWAWHHQILNFDELTIDTLQFVDYIRFSVTLTGYVIFIDNLKISYKYTA